MVNFRVPSATAVSVALVLLALTGAGTAQADSPAGLVVFAAQGVNLKPGDTVDGTKPFTLEAGQSATLISDSGKMLKLRGPYSAVPLSETGRQGATVTDALAALASAPRTTSATLGASRDAAGTVHLAPGGGPEGPAAARSKGGSIGGILSGDDGVPEPWVISVAGSGHRCAREGSELIFWRTDKNPEQEIKVGIASESWRARTRWPGGYAKLAAPDTMPRLDGSVFTVDVGSASTTLTLHIMPQSVTAAPVLAAWMVEKGCISQAAALMRTKG